MLPKNWAIGVGVVTLSLAALFGFACDDDESTSNGDPVATDTDTGGDETPEE